MAEIDAKIDLKSLDKGIKGVIIILTDDAYNTLDKNHDVMRLIKEAKELELKTIIDLDPSTSSKWFENSEKGTNNSDYYIWRTGTQEDGSMKPPNNWVRFSCQFILTEFFFVDNFLICRYVPQIHLHGHTQKKENSISMHLSRNHC